MVVAVLFVSEVAAAFAAEVAAAVALLAAVWQVS